MIQILDKTELVIGDVYLIYKKCHYKYLYIGVCCYDYNMGYHCKSHLEAYWRSPVMDCRNHGNEAGWQSFKFIVYDIFKLTDDESSSVIAGII